MSMYNMVCGNNPLFGLFARILETKGKLPPIPRFRDMYTREEGRVQIVLYTRTGGGNRAEYAEANAEITKHPLFVTDFNDSFDSTFAHWVFDVPDDFQQRMLNLHTIMSRHPKGMPPGDKFKLAMGQMEPPEELTSTDLDLLSVIGAGMMDNLPKRSSLEIALSEHTKLNVPH